MDERNLEIAWTMEYCAEPVGRQVSRLKTQERKMIEQIAEMENAG